MVVSESSETTAEITQIVFPAEPGIAESESLQAELSHALSSGQGVCLKLHEITKPSTAVVQLITSTIKHAIKHGLKIQASGPTKPLIDAFNDLGLYKYLMQAECIS